MQIYLETPVAQSVREVFPRFDRDLFSDLAPPFPPLLLDRFDGSQIGDEVHLRIGFPPFRMRWISVITEHAESDTECRFVDEGRVLPLFLRAWRHEHTIRANDPSGATIIDDIRFEPAIPGTGAILYQMMIGQFRYRQPVYRRIFGAPPAA